MRTVTARFGRLPRKTSEDLADHLAHLEKGLERELYFCRALRAIVELPIDQQPTVAALTPDLRAYLELQLVAQAAVKSHLVEMMDYPLGGAA